MTEAEARLLLHDYGGFDGLEAWMAEQPWKAVPGGWTITSELQGWRPELPRHIPAGHPCP